MGLTVCCSFYILIKFSLRKHDLVPVGVGHSKAIYAVELDVFKLTRCNISGKSG